ncbi:MAG: HEPN domain-containing protein, partial [Planctomycetaceae bacterium]|nr:HEPN domain-containing protein [Planctomycetaceae bacterium]
MTVLKQTKKWFRRAKKDLHSARLVAKGREWEDVCFHSQQAVEKALKGYLVQHGTDPPKIHDLVVLVQYCAKFDEVFFQYQKQCAY